MHCYIFLRTCSRKQIDSFIGFMLNYLSDISDDKKWKKQIKRVIHFRELVKYTCKADLPKSKEKEIVLSISHMNFVYKMKQICSLKTDSWTNKHCYRINNFIYILVKICNCVGCRDYSFSEPKST